MSNEDKIYCENCKKKSIIKDKSSETGYKCTECGNIQTIAKNIDDIHPKFRCLSERVTANKIAVEEAKQEYGILSKENTIISKELCSFPQSKYNNAPFFRKIKKINKYMKIIEIFISKEEMKNL